MLGGGGGGVFNERGGGGGPGGEGHEFILRADESGKQNQFQKTKVEKQRNQESRINVKCSTKNSKILFAVTNL